MSKPNGIVLELQRDCLDTQTSASAILRKAKVIASKLDLEDLAKWIDEELNGYKGRHIDLPRHRKGSGSPKFWNPYNGWCPIVAGDEKLANILNTAYFSEPIAQLEQWASDPNANLTYRYPYLIQEHLNKSSSMPIEGVMHISVSAITSALDFVRNKVLDWTLELEKNGIVGEDFSFEASQKIEAKMVTNHIYGSNIGVLGNVAGDSNNSRFINGGMVDVQKISDFLDKAVPASNGLNESTQTQVQPILRDIGTAIASKPQSNVISTLMNSLRSILEGASGDIVAAAILASMIGHFA